MATDRLPSPEWTDPESGARVRLFDWYGGPDLPGEDSWSGDPDVDAAVDDRLRILVSMLVVAGEAEDLLREAGSLG